MPLPGAEDAIAADLATVAMRVADEDMPDLPPLNVVVSRIELPPAVMATYKTMQRELFAAVEGRAIEAASAMVATGKCAQLANGFLYGEGAEDPVAVHDLKLEWLRELVESLDGEPLLIAYEFVEDLRAIRRVFGETPALGGQTPGKEAARLIEAWNEGALPLLAFHPASAGHGLNLQFGGARMAWLSPSWSAELTEQAIARIYRPGQSAPCHRACLRRRRHRRRNEARPGARQDVGPRGVPAPSGAAMRDCTAFRLAMLANGFTPLLNDGKRSIEKGWPRQRVTEADVMAWDRSLLATTGLRIDDDLAVIDVDIVEPAIVQALAETLDKSFPELFARGLVRHAGGGKEAWIARVDEPFARLASWRWHRGDDPDSDPKQTGRMLRLAGDATIRHRRAARSQQRLPVHRRRLAGDAAPERAADIAQGGLRRGLQPVRRDRQSRGVDGRQRAPPGRLRWRDSPDIRTRRRDDDRHRRPRRDDDRRAGAPGAGAAKRRGAALLGQLPRRDAKANRQPPDQLGPLRPRRPRLHDRGDVASARAGALRDIRIPGAAERKNGGDG